MTGNPVISIITGIKDDEFHNKIDKQILESQNTQCYIFTKLAFEMATQSKLKTFKVIKRGF